MLIYFVFSKDLNGDGSSARYLGLDRNAAIENFLKRQGSAVELSLEITRKPRTVYIVGFDSESDLGKQLKQLVDTNSGYKAKTFIPDIIDNIDSADYAASFIPNMVLFRRPERTNTVCPTCNKRRVNLQKTAYGMYLCDDCWEDYVHSTDDADHTKYPGLVEYAIGICAGAYTRDEFTETELDKIKTAWSEYNTLINKYLEGELPETSEPETT